MAFQIKLYQNTAEDNVIDKTSKLVLKETLTGTLRQATSIVSPSITFEYEGLLDFNYVYIPQFKRYYFLGNLTSINNNLWQMDLNVDVLMSFKTEILSQTCLIDRCENTDYQDLYIPDNLVTIENRVDNTIVELPNSVFLDYADNTPNVPWNSTCCIVGVVIGKRPSES